MRTRKYLATDGKLVLTLKTLPAGKLEVTSPFDPTIALKVSTLKKAFAAAYQAGKKPKLAAKRKKVEPSNRTATR